MNFLYYGIIALFNVAQSVLKVGVIEGVFTGQNYLIAKRLLDASALRQEALAGNIANIETPGFKRMDVDKSFDAQLTQAVKNTNVEALMSLRPQLSVDTSAAAVRADGNNVSMDKELMEVNRNAVEYQFLTQYLSNNLQSIKNAINTNLNS